jgi:hypothetical protein
MKQGLAGDLFQFDRTGEHLLAANADGVAAVAVKGERTTHIARRGVRAVAGFGDQIWIATADALERFDLDGRALGEPFALAGDPAETWAPAPCGPPGVVLANRAIIDDVGTLFAHEHPYAELLIPFTARQVLVVHGAYIQMPSSLVTTLPPTGRVLGGSVLADGKSVVLVTTHHTGRCVALVSIANGQLVSRFEIEGGLVRLASRRALAVVHREGRLEVLDLRAGRELGSFAIAQEVDDLAIDPDGQLVAIRHGSEVELVDLQAQLRTIRLEPVAAIAVPRVFTERDTTTLGEPE